MRSGGDYIVSGDNDLLRVKSFRDMPIVKVSKRSGPGG
jgi:hypothetical protein